MTETILNAIKSHLNTQLLTISGVAEALNVDLTRNISTKVDWLGFYHVIKMDEGTWSVSKRNIPGMYITLRVGIGIGDTSKDSHNNQVETAGCRLHDWFKTWNQSSTYLTISDVQDCQFKNSNLSGISSKDGLRSIVYLELEFTIK